MTSEITQDTKFPQFDVVSDPSGHHYHNQAQTSKPTPSAQKKIMQEWKLLSKELPESIYVRVYETRTDLIRAAIVGARGTPYHDGLFFFDVAFPPDYPARPPLVHYLSFGFRVNPNLYANGRVCLSLLHTWTGKKCEKWDSNNSNILQVLLSIQALVLNEKPFFNEPAYGPFSGKSHFEKKSLAYSENTFVLSCKTMYNVLLTPPKHFAPVVKQHFVERAEFILNASDMYRKGLFKVGMFNGIVVKEGNNNNNNKVNVSKKFVSSIDSKWFDDFVNALAENGAEIERFVERVRNKENNPVEEPVLKTGKGGLMKKLKIFFTGLMKKKTKTSPVSDKPLS